MPWPLIAAIAGLAGTGVSVGEALSQPKPVAPTLPAQSINPTNANAIAASTQASAPGVNPGLVNDLISQVSGGNPFTTGVGTTNSAGSFVPASSNAGGSTTPNSAGLTLLDYLPPEGQ